MTQCYISTLWIRRAKLWHRKATTYLRTTRRQDFRPILRCSILPPPPTTMCSERGMEMDSPNKRVRVKSPWIRQQQQQQQQQRHQAPLSRQHNYYFDDDQSVEMMR